MFDSGTKVIVLASSHRGPTGVKKGSVGFFQETESNGRIVYDPEQKVCAVPATVVFTRYGFEKKFRCEKKRVIVLFPEINANYADVSGQVAKLSRRIQSGRDDCWNRARNICGLMGSKSPVVILGPAGVGKGTIDNMRSSEIVAWLESMLTSEKMMSWLASATQDHYINRSNHPNLTEDMMYWLRELATGKDSRWKLIKDPGNLKATLTAVRLADIVRQRSQIQYDIDYIRLLSHNDKYMCVLQGKEKVNKTAVASCFYSVMFRPHMYEKLKLSMLAEYGTRITKYLSEPEAVRGCILVLSACLERTGKIDGKKAMSVGQ